MCPISLNILFLRSIPIHGGAHGVEEAFAFGGGDGRFGLLIRFLDQFGGEVAQEGRWQAGEDLAGRAGDRFGRHDPPVYRH